MTMSEIRPPSPLLVDRRRVERGLQTLLERLTIARRPDGWWEGRLSSSALSTATAVSALSVAAAEQPRRGRLIVGGVAWLAATQNPDGGWGDTTDSPSNLATTALVIAALTRAQAQDTHATTLESARQWMASRTNGVNLVDAISAIYGADRTFAVPILANCALAGLVPWERVPRLPFGLAVLPRSWYKSLRMDVVSYALPALIALGLLLDERKRSANPLRKLVRSAAEKTLLKKLAAIQPESGGFLEATPLSSFVAMSLSSVFGAHHPVAANCLDFIEQSVRSDGSWPIDSNLSVWLTTSAVKALDGAGCLKLIDAGSTTRWIEARQSRGVHPYTGALPGAWGWTHLSGGVPDVDDTSSAILALTALGGSAKAVADGARWLLSLQNSDGGWPTFCRGWGKLPFDTSSPDLTAHALRVLAAAKIKGAEAAISSALRYLQRSQQENGAWVPLWFGNQSAPGKRNEVIGTSLVLRALRELNVLDDAAAAATGFLVTSQNADGGWGGAAGVASTTEETALAVSALVACSRDSDGKAAARRGVAHLVSRIEDSRLDANPIGLYFSHLWYSEELYPLIWSVEALGRTLQREADLC